jgi:hypothetical protein
MIFTLMALHMNADRACDAIRSDMRLGAAKRALPLQARPVAAQLSGGQPPTQSRMAATADVVLSVRVVTNSVSNII